DGTIVPVRRVPLCTVAMAALAQNLPCGCAVDQSHRAENGHSVPRWVFNPECYMRHMELQGWKKPERAS
ncbi:MAG: hypothetical protein WA766_21525, partial [Candidatus Acidiferrales bacterium]